jgi:hypothetical protein
MRKPPKISHYRTSSKIKHQNHRRCKTVTPNTQKHDHSLSWLCTGTCIKVAGGKLLFLCPRPPLLVKWCGQASAFNMWEKCQPSQITQNNGANSVIIKSATILNIVHNIVNQKLSYIYNISSIKDSRWPEPISKY